MTKTQEALKRINILICQIATDIETGNVLQMGYVQKTTDEIDEIINQIKD